KVKIREEEKFKALYARDTKRIDNAFNVHMDTEEQIKNFESRRIELHKELGLENKSFKEIINSVSGEEQTQLNILYDDLVNSVNVVKEFNKRSLDFAQMNIDIVNEMTGIFTDSKSYNANGTQTNQTTRPNILNKKA
ncbi:MAG: flagellar export chaperone FlgN, partial [Oscillospiraceae bacterium]|nr:flagellar export chaperone FlgN [Oscillospiraceae bacterium]